MLLEIVVMVGIPNRHFFTQSLSPQKSGLSQVEYSPVRSSIRAQPSCGKPVLDELVEGLTFEDSRERDSLERNSMVKVLRSKYALCAQEIQQTQ